MLASFRFARYTVLTSPNKDETAAHGYGLSLPVFVVLVSRKFTYFHVASAFPLCLYVSSSFWLIRSLQILRNLQHYRWRFFAAEFNKFCLSDGLILGVTFFRRGLLLEGTMRGCKMGWA